MLFPLSLAIACSDLPPIESKQGCECLEAFKSHPGWLLSHPTPHRGFASWGPWLIIPRTHPRAAQRSAQRRHSPSRHPRSTQLLSVCLFDRRPPARPAGQKKTNRSSFHVVGMHMHAGVFLFLLAQPIPSRSRTLAVDASISAAVCAASFSSPSLKLKRLFFFLE